VSTAYMQKWDGKVAKYLKEYGVVLLPP